MGEADMTEAVSFALRNRNPDVLTCIANLSNDEVFTPPDFANRMLDLVEEAWAQGNGGANIWADPTVKFLDPFTKSGVFPREITRRLVAGLEQEIPDLAERVDHVLVNQVFGIAITHLTSLIARRSLYCSKWANGQHSVARSFDSEAGNIWFEPGGHSWAGATEFVEIADESGKPVRRGTNGKCQYCGASQKTMDRAQGLESHAYAFIHTDDVQVRLAEMFGEDVHFDVIVGNPPYQMASDGGTRDIPIYQHFVRQAKKLEPRLISMVIPSRWMAAGLGLRAFREEMLADRQIRQLVDYPDSRELFPGVQLNGGACYFLWERKSEGPCTTALVREGEVIGPIARQLDEFDILVRDPRALSVLRKVRARGEPTMDEILSADKEFGLTSNFDNHRPEPFDSGIPLFAYQGRRRIVAWIDRKQIEKSQELIDTYKVLIPAAGFEAHILPTPVISSLRRAPNPSVCTQTYLFVPADSEEEADSIESYVLTRFFRFLVWLRKVSQHATRSTYAWVPQQSWDRDWSDPELYAAYDLTDEEVAYIEGTIRAVEDTDE